MVYSGSKKHNISFNMNHEINKWLTVNSRISYDQMRVEGMTFSTFIRGSGNSPSRQG